MVAPARTLPRADSAPARPSTEGVRLAGIAHRVFPERAQPLIGGDLRLAQDVLSAYGRGDEFDSFLSRSGNSFVAMSEGVLGQLTEPPPATDALLLAYQTPDLHYSDVAGCYLAQRLPGTPVPFSVAEQGPGAVFTALRLAEGMHRLGESRRTAVFVYDQNAAVWDADEEVQRRPDAAVLLQLGTTGEVVVSELAEITAGDPVRALEELSGRHPGVRLLVGAGLAARLVGSALEGRVEAAPVSAECTGVWARLAEEWPLREPVLIADHRTPGEWFTSCLLTPEAGR